jgi:NADH-quinone oxidoreductase subunit A
MTSPTTIVAYLALFTAAGASFLFANLLVGKFLRPKSPNTEKLEIYECGEPTIGSSFVQFDLRFYVVALLFIIFDVEIAFFFPWATVFGKATHLMDPQIQAEIAADPDHLAPAAVAIYRELGVQDPAKAIEFKPGDGPANAAAIERSAGKLAMISIADIGVFFAVLLVGFAYVWKRGDLDWVRAVSQERAAAPTRGPTTREEETALSA